LALLVYSRIGKMRGAFGQREFQIRRAAGGRFAIIPGTR
jgi:hypothetical protein